MRRSLCRWAINIFCSLSLLIFLLAMGIWVRGRSANERVSWAVKWAHSTTPRKWRSINYGMEWSRGTVCFYRNGQDLDDPPSPQRLYYSHLKPRDDFIQPPRPIDRFNFRIDGFQLWHAVGLNPQRWVFYQIAVVPLWLFMPFVIPPLLWVRRWRSKRGRGFPVEVTAASAANDTILT